MFMRPSIFFRLAFTSRTWRSSCLAVLGRRGLALLRHVHAALHLLPLGFHQPHLALLLLLELLLTELAHRREVLLAHHLLDAREGRGTLLLLLLVLERLLLEEHLVGHELRAALLAHLVHLHLALLRLELLDAPLREELAQERLPGALALDELGLKRGGVVGRQLAEQLRAELGV